MSKVKAGVIKKEFPNAIKREKITAENIVGTGSFGNTITVGTINASPIERAADTEQHGEPVPEEKIPAGKVIVRETRVVPATPDGGVDLTSEGIPHTVLDTPTD